MMNKTKKKSTKPKTNNTKKHITTFKFSNNLNELFISSCLKCKYPSKIYIHDPVLVSDNKLIDNI